MAAPPIPTEGSDPGCISFGATIIAEPSPRIPAAPPIPPRPEAAGAPSPTDIDAPDSRAASQPPLEEKVAAEVRAVNNEEPKGTIIDGIEDDNLWVLLRSFNTQVNHVLHPTTDTPANQPDLRHTSLPNVPYRSDTLKSNLERLIAGVSKPCSRGVREVRRMADWKNEFYRTAAFCGAYFVSWILGYTLVACALFWIVLICFPRMRRFLFSAAAPPTESLLGSENVPLTRAEKAEEKSVEVSAIMTGYASTLLVGSKEEGNGAVGPKDINSDNVETSDSGKTEAERKRDEIVMTMAKMTETTIGDIADMIEMMQKALSPPAVYPDHYARFKFAAQLVVPALALHYVPARIVCRSLTFAFGVVFWGHEWLARAAKEFVRLVPDWRKRIDMRNTILSGVPTDAQLVLHLLRVSEAEGDPLPAPPNAPAVEDADPVVPDPHGLGVENHPPRKAAKATSKDIFKRVARKLAGMGNDFAIDGSKGMLRSTIDMVVLKAKWGLDARGYTAKLNGTNGHLFLDDKRLSWVPLRSRVPDKTWCINDLVEMKKDGLGTRRLALAMMVGSEIASLGLTLRFTKTERNLDAMTEEEKVHPAQSSDESYVFRGVEAREELFNRLIAMGSQRWAML